ncbi:MAG: dTDP-glucose 4,6-dehydratase [Anaerolineales bacterium]
MRNILVTGGAGFIGSNFVRYILTHEPDLRVWNIDALTYAGSLANLKELPNADRHILIEGDICDQSVVENIIRKNHIDTIVHFAAESHVDRSILGPGAFVRTNIQGTFSLLEAARKIWIDEGKVTSDSARFHHISTDEVYGSLGPMDPAFSETTAYAPNSPYAASKAASDHLVRAYGQTYELPILVTNCSNNYGPYQFPEKLIPLMILNALQGLPLPVYGDGQQIRDWLYVEDHCKAILTVLKSGKVGETYIIGGNNQPTNLEIVEVICAILDEFIPESSHVPHNQLIQFVRDRPGHDRRYAMNIEKIQAELKWEPAEELHSGLRKTVAWYLENELWVKSIVEEKDYQMWMDVNYAHRGDNA